MTNLLIILAALFIALAIIVPLAERFAKPVDENQARNYSRIIMILLSLVMLGSVLKYALG